MTLLNRLGGATVGALALALMALASTARADTTTNAPVKPDLLTTCPVSGEKLGEMGAPYKFVYQGQEVKLCCTGCKKDFDKNPAKYIKKIREADKTATNKNAKAADKKP